MFRLFRVVLVFSLSTVFCIKTLQTNAAAPLDLAYERATPPVASVACDGRPADKRTYCWRNCTSYVAYRLATAGVSPSQYQYLGDARHWAARARARGIQSSLTPRVGSVAYWTAGGRGYGHVAWVEAVNPDGSVKTKSYDGFSESYIERDNVVAEGYLYFSNTQVPAAVSAPAVYKGERLRPGQTLAMNEFLRSRNGRYTLYFRPDGSLVILSPTRRTIWQAYTRGRPANLLAMQPDGNFVLYIDNTPLWHTWTWTRGRAFAVMQNDGNLVVYATTGKAIWQSGTLGKI